LEETGACSGNIFVIDTVRTKVRPKSSIRPSQIRRRGVPQIGIFIVHELVKLVTLDLGIAPEVPAIDQPLAHIRVPPPAVSRVVRSGIVISNEPLKLLLLDLCVRFDDAVFNEPGLEFGLVPIAVSGVLCAIVVVLHELDQLVTLFLVVSAHETTIMQPFELIPARVSEYVEAFGVRWTYNARITPRLPDGVGYGSVVFLHQYEQLLAFGLAFGLDDPLVLEIRPQFVVAPCRVDLQKKDIRLMSSIHSSQMDGTQQNVNARNL
jgi:hypothetical protein